MLNRYNSSLLFALCCGTGLYLLGTEPKRVAKLDSEPKPSELAATEQDPSIAKNSPEKKQPVLSTPDQPETQGEPTQVAFEPPFPHRTKLFQAPKRQGRGQAKLKGQSESDVELLGFVNVNGQRVALSIDGLVTTVAEGDKQFGIEVISIQPPSVVLQRGRQRWQATFDN